MYMYLDYVYIYTYIFGIRGGYTVIHVINQHTYGLSLIHENRIESAFSLHKPP